jgi:metal-dependent amidase/aminoacylase/carboxypeptidase family protein
MVNDGLLQAVYYQNAQSLAGEGEVLQSYGHMAGSTDMGDVSQIMPAIHPYAGGTTGITHGNDFCISDYETAVILPAKIMATTVVDLLANGAAKAKDIKARSKPAFAKEQYLSLMDSLLSEAQYGE